jgi:predicted acylesterase/phospholipase RssA
MSDASTRCEISNPAIAQGIDLGPRKPLRVDVHHRQGNRSRVIRGQLGMAMDRTSNTAWAHLILAGAGVLSLSYAGALTALYERGIRFRSVSSCSSGTLIGALLCARGTPEGLIKDVQNFSLAHLKGRRASPLPDFLYAAIPWLFSVHPLFKWPFAQYRSPGFSEAFRERIGGDPTFKDLKIRRRRFRHRPTALSRLRQ